MDNELPHALERDALCKLCAILNEFDAEAKERLLTWAAWPLEGDKPLRQLKPLSKFRSIVEEVLRLRADRDAALSRARDAEADMLKVAETARREARVAWVAERDAAVAEAVRVERERAAAMMEDYWNSRNESFYANDTAAAIRRGE